MPNLSDLIGPTGTIAVAGGAFIGIGVAYDKYVAPKARASFALLLVSGGLNRRVLWIPDGTYALFERIFGTKHFTIKCLFRSAVFTLASIAAGLLLAAFHGKSWWYSLSIFAGRRDTMGFLVFTWIIPVALLIDFLNLYKSRLVLRWMTKQSSPSIMAMAVALALDFSIYYAVFCFSLICLFFAIILSQVPWGVMDAQVGLIRDEFFHAMWVQLRDNYAILIGVLRGTDTNPFNRYFSVLFLASLVPSLWTWTWVAATALAKAVARSHLVFKNLRNQLPFEEKPGQSIGVLAAGIFAIVVLLFDLISWWVG
jgi:hypothetical protein